MIQNLLGSKFDILRNKTEKDFDDKDLIIEAFKEKDINNINNKKLILNYDYDKLIKFRQFY